MENETVKWVAEIEVTKNWVADGFELTEERLHNMMCDNLDFAYPHEIKVKIIQAPAPEEIERLQNGDDEDLTEKCEAATREFDS